MVYRSTIKIFVPHVHCSLNIAALININLLFVMSAVSNCRIWYSRASLIRIIHISGHLFENQFIFFNRKWHTYPKFQLSGQSVLGRRCPDKWGSTVIYKCVNLFFLFDLHFFWCFNVLDIPCFHKPQDWQHGHGEIRQ